MKHNPLIIAMDVPTPARALEIARSVKGRVEVVKVGYPLFIQGGTALVDHLMQDGFKVFLDLKWHDIPNTVANAIKALGTLRPFMATLHASGGSAMLQAAVTARNESQPSGERTRLLAVTVLTSVDQATLNGELRVAGPVAAHVENLAGLAQAAGVEGVVASPHEIAPLRALGGTPLLIVTPGIRPAFETRSKGTPGGLGRPDDQKRVMTPAEAIRLGADYLVIGRPIVEAQDPAGAAEKIFQEVQEVLSR